MKINTTFLVALLFTTALFYSCSDKGAYMPPPVDTSAQSFFCPPGSTGVYIHGGYQCISDTYCSSDHQCAENQFCNSSGYCQYEETYVENYGTLGHSCPGGDDECAPGFACISSVCKIEANESGCDNHAHCATGYCQMESGTKYCRKRYLKNGEQCYLPSDGNSQECLNQICAPTGYGGYRCGYKPGEECSSDDECQRCNCKVGGGGCSAWTPWKKCCSHSNEC